MRVPTRKERALLDVLTFFRGDECTSRQSVVFENVALFADNLHMCGFVEDYAYLDFVAVGIDLRKRNARDIFVMDCAVVARRKFGSFDRLCNAADVEGSHRKLGAGLANGLRRNNADSRSALDKLLRRGVYAVRLCGN